MSDLLWIYGNLQVFVPAARTGYEKMGRGAVTVDTTIIPVPGGGNPMLYLTEDQVAEYFSEDELRLVSAYRPASEFVAILLKELNRTSSYRFQVPTEFPEP